MRARTAARTRTAKLEAERRRRASSSGVGVGAGLEEAHGILVLAQLRDEQSLARERVLALECRCSSARDKTAFTAVLERERRRHSATHPPQPVLHDNAPHNVDAPRSVAVL